MFARFIGKNGSMGLKHGEVYEISLSEYHGLPCVHWAKLSGFLSLRNSEDPCPYSSFKTLAENWEIVMR